MLRAIPPEPSNDTRYGESITRLTKEHVVAKEFHLGAKDLLAMVQVEPGSLGKYAVIPGPITRVEPVIKKLNDPVKDFSFQGIEMYTGELDDILVTTANSGMYAPPGAIVSEMVAAGGSEYLIRPGSCGALKEEINIGDLVIVTGCVRGEGTSAYYAPDNFSTVADFVVTQALVDACEKLGATYHVGTVWSTDALLRESKELIDQMCELQVMGVDMVTSSLLTVSQIKGVKAGAVLAVSDNLITGELGFVSPKFYEAETTTIDVALEAVRILEAGK
jgi:uridine phosphorylase